MTIVEKHFSPSTAVHGHGLARGTGQTLYHVWWNFSVMAASTPALPPWGGREVHGREGKGTWEGEGRVHGRRQCHRMFQQPRREGHPSQYTEYFVTRIQNRQFEHSNHFWFGADSSRSSHANKLLKKARQSSAPVICTPQLPHFSRWMDPTVGRAGRGWDFEFVKHDWPLGWEPDPLQPGCKGGGCFEQQEKLFSWSAALTQWPNSFLPTLKGC